MLKRLRSWIRRYYNKLRCSHSQVENVPNLQKPLSENVQIVDLDVDKMRKETRDQVLRKFNLDMDKMRELFL